MDGSKVLALVIVGVGVALLGALLLAIFGAIPLWLLWNWLCPELFGLPCINLWQSFGLLILFGLLFKSPVSKGGKS